MSRCKNTFSDLWRGSMKKKNFKITLSTKDMERLLNDKMKKSVNYNGRIYRCKIFHKCKKKQKERKKQRNSGRKSRSKKRKQNKNKSNVDKISFRGPVWGSKIFSW